MTYRFFLQKIENICVDLLIKKFVMYVLTSYLDMIKETPLLSSLVKHDRLPLILLLERRFNATRCFHLNRYIYFLILSVG